MADVKKSITYPWVVVTIDNKMYAFSAEYVQTMVLMPPVAAVPQSPPYVRGVINLRGKVMTLVDLRVRLGMISTLDETHQFITMMEEREKDHRNWLTKLEACVKDKRPIDVQTDPHQCAFGKWYDSFQTDNLTLAGLLRKFDVPHKRIHAIAHSAGALVQDNKYEGALSLIDSCRHGDLAEMIQLFQTVRHTYYELLREIALVVEVGSQHIAIAVDKVESVEFLKEDSFESLSKLSLHAQEKDLVTLVARREKSDHMVLIIDPVHVVHNEVVV